MRDSVKIGTARNGYFDDLDKLIHARRRQFVNEAGALIPPGTFNVNADWDATSGDAEILNKPDLGTAAAKDVPATGNASATEVVLGTDTRLTDARPMTFLDTSTGKTYVLSGTAGALQCSYDGGAPFTIHQF